MAFAALRSFVGRIDDDDPPVTVPEVCEKKRTALPPPSMVLGAAQLSGFLVDGPVRWSRFAGARGVLAHEHGAGIGSATPPSPRGLGMRELMGAKRKASVRLADPFRTSMWIACDPCRTIALGEKRSAASWPKSSQ